MDRIYFVFSSLDCQWVQVVNMNEVTGEIPIYLPKVKVADGT